MDSKPKDWVEHSAFGLGRVNEDRGDRLDIHFVNSGAKTILKTADLKPALPPSADFKFPHDKGKSHAPQFKVEGPPVETRLSVHEDAAVFRGLVIHHTGDISIVETGTFLLWYDIDLDSS